MLYTHPVGANVRGDGVKATHGHNDGASLAGLVIMSGDHLSNPGRLPRNVDVGGSILGTGSHQAAAILVEWAHGREDNPAASSHKRVSECCCLLCGCDAALCLLGQAVERVWVGCVSHDGAQVGSTHALKACLHMNEGLRV